MLDAIPEEILLAIIEQIPRKGDLERLCAVSRKIYDITIPFLYNAITINAGGEGPEEEAKLEITNAGQFLRSPDPRRYLSLISNLSFQAPIHHLVKFRCIHHNLFHDADEREDSEFFLNSDEFELTTGQLGGLMGPIRPIFEALKNDSLHSFSWHLGTCVPLEILGPEGYLPTRQKGIESLSLVTGDPCICLHREWDHPLCLAEFKSLRRFSWTGGLSRENFDCLRDALHANSEHLEELALDLLDWWDAQWNWCDFDAVDQAWISHNNFFAPHVLAIAPGKQRILFPRLKKLSLSAVSFNHVSLEMATSFDFSTLRSLTLRHCVDTDSFLRSILASTRTVRLTELELVVGGTDLKPEPQGRLLLTKFLESFVGLRQLYILIKDGDRPDVASDYWSGIFHHHATLRRLVCCDAIGHEYADMGTGGFTPNVDTYPHFIGEVMNKMQLEYLTFYSNCCRLDHWSDNTITGVSRSSLRILHIRPPSPEDPWCSHHHHSSTGNNHTNNDSSNETPPPPSGFSKFATWAFDPASGFPNLEFLILGTLAGGGGGNQHLITDEDTLVFARYPFPDLRGGGARKASVVDSVEILARGVQIVTREKRELWERLLETGGEFLVACPDMPLFEKDF